MSSKNQKAAEARAKAQAQVRAQERRTTLMIIAGSVAGLAIFAAVVIFIVNQGKVPELGSDGATSPVASDSTGGIPVGTSGVVGVDVPTDAVRVDIYLDYMCPICGVFEDTNAADIDEMREAGDIQVYYHPISILDRYSNGTNYSTRSAAAAGVVANDAPEAFLDFSNALFANQPAENTDGLSDDEIEQIALDAGVPADVAGSLVNDDFKKWATAATQQASVDGMQGTPTVRISATGSFDDGLILNADSSSPSVDYFTDGNLKAYIESLG
ncbi:DsbA family protein [Demequina lignilytica]|uniref:Thioredoxin domain-containing protein n=1 Tax=Demequina lignilytica TaxID=3051663 RepID=A0AAW7M9N5_9MICO|nr:MULTISPECIES: thioredoxin domain-containing protein [unclassified Demequina]MDN4477498.1 thioredoxin domain-containing protein [Demequina sp. SYSU T00039-1]MDN4483542.1 thioredoxin domain-containing protein [Demequina sp. SYSU T0a273]MDN4488151.1 thioredoxin domain-containing protein [Demequina sp. SYSU T00039]MDN4490592.1 thioredoxin domain-containing protein [Demequina sp. SYSU T00068]